MTDNEIIKAMELCASKDYTCVECLYGSCMDLTKDAFDLINRQKAEIERLEADLKVKNQVLKDRELTPYPFDDDHERRTSYLHLVNRQQAEIVKLEAETDRLNYILQCYALEHGTVGDKERLLKEARDEAVKEFAERIKGESGKCVVEQNGHEIYETKYYTLNAITLDNLVKEFTEGKNDG